VQGTKLCVEQWRIKPTEERELEIVERKGLGHPDHICDAIVEEAAVALSRYYYRTLGHLVHFNLDKALLASGASVTELGGGRIVQPMRMIFGGRATCEWKGRAIPVTELIEEAANRWLDKNLRFVEPGRDMVFQDEVREGSPELVDIFHRQAVGANDTSVATGYAPMTDTERVVLATEQYANSAEFKSRFPESGEDIKIMGIRQGRQLQLVVAMAFVDRFVDSEDVYFRQKQAISADLLAFANRVKGRLQKVTIILNALDRPGRGIAGMYLTVSGTSAEEGDSGQVGRGNRVNGLIPFSRPLSTEAVAGKNPVSHVGKAYSVLSQQIAETIHREVPGVREVYVQFCGEIGRPVDQPLVASVALVPHPRVRKSDIAPRVTAIVEQGLQGIYDLTHRLALGEIPLP